MQGRLLCRTLQAPRLRDVILASDPANAKWPNLRPIPLITSRWAYGDQNATYNWRYLSRDIQMATFIVRVRNEPHLVITEKKSKAVWVASGAYKGGRYIAQAVTEDAAVTRWRERALEGRLNWRVLSDSGPPKRRRGALPREQLFRH